MPHPAWEAGWGHGVLLRLKWGWRQGRGGFVNHFFSVLVVPDLSNHVYFIGTASSQNGLVCSLFLRLPSKRRQKSRRLSVSLWGRDLKKGFPSL